MAHIGRDNAHNDVNHLVQKKKTHTQHTEVRVMLFWQQKPQHSTKLKQTSRAIHTSHTWNARNATRRDSLVPHDSSSRRYSRARTTKGKLGLMQMRVAHSHTAMLYKYILITPGMFCCLIIYSNTVTKLTQTNRNYDVFWCFFEVKFNYSFAIRLMCECDSPTILRNVGTKYVV